MKCISNSRRLPAFVPEVSQKCEHFLHTAVVYSTCKEIVPAMYEISKYTVRLKHTILFWTTWIYSYFLYTIKSIFSVGWSK